MFSEDMHDLAARIEPYPHRYLMATVDGELALISSKVDLTERDRADALLAEIKTTFQLLSQRVE